MSQSAHSSTDQAMIKLQGESYESMNHQRSTPIILVMGTYAPFELPFTARTYVPFEVLYNVVA